MDIKETFISISKKLSDALIEKSSEYISITPSNVLSTVFLVFVSLLLIYVASIVTKKGIKILLYVVGSLLIILVVFNLIQNI